MDKDPLEGIKLEETWPSRMPECDHKGYIMIITKWVGCNMCGIRWKLPSELILVS
ncbi:hypothetical protein LCGC14_2981340 [marine sediment metagenome]|uniref:Uncharacterized protein n=1 Tax=marine sediment metagenome TaxID=412755 RepID=A0A0F8XU09_9ZZZZ